MPKWFETDLGMLCFAYSKPRCGVICFWNGEAISLLEDRL